MEERDDTPSRLPLLILILAAGALVVSVVALVRGGGSEPTTDVAAELEAVLAEATPGPAESAVVFAQVAQSFVVVEVDRAAEVNDARTDRGLGSGVIIDAQGQILTARHVVVDADEIRVTYADGTQSVAEVSTTDPERDIAVLRTDQGPEVLVPAVLGSVATVNDLELFGLLRQIRVRIGTREVQEVRRRGCVRHRDRGTALVPRVR